MTRKLYWEQPYSQDFTAKIVGSDGTRVELDQTLFYPRGGGVSCDTGVLVGVKVVETS
ncbi:alanyl-tRNA editing protein, partial [Candidatus Bathyarchaeota archaeon]